MSYQPVNWKDHVPERPLTYTLQHNADGTVTLIPAHGTILQEGTPANAANLNHMEQGLVSHMADYVRQPAFTVTGGTSTAYTATLDPAPANIVEGFSITIVPHVTCGANPTLNVNGKGATQLRNGDNEQLAAGDLLAGRPYSFRKVGSYFFLSSGVGGVKIEFENYKQLADKVTRVESSPTALSAGRADLSGVSLDGYALFAGGYSYPPNAYYATVDAYDIFLTRTTPTALSVGRVSPTGGAVGDYALFAGGSSYDAARVYHNAVDAYNGSLTRTTPTPLSTGRECPASAPVGDYVLFAGGTTTSYSNIVDAYNGSLIRTTPTALSASRENLAGASVGDYALFAGGRGSSSSSVVNAYNASLVRTIPSSLSTARYNLAGASVGDYALFAGGYAANSNIVDAYNGSLIRTTPTALSVNMHKTVGASIDKQYAVFTYGEDPVVNAYNASLVRTVPTSLATTRRRLACASVNGYALFSGGESPTTSNTYYDAVDAYNAYSTEVPIMVTQGSKYMFDGTERVAEASGYIIVTAPANGYVKYKRGVIS